MSSKLSQEQNLAETYQQKTDIEHILDAPDTYVGSVEKDNVNGWILDEENNISALSMYWMFLLVVWLAFFLMIYIFNDSFIAWCKTLIS